MGKRFKKPNKAIRRIAMAIMIFETIGVCVPIVVKAVSKQDMPIITVEVIEVQPQYKYPDEIVREELSQVNILFSDESNQEPYAGYEVTLSEWENMPEWNIPEEYQQTGGCLPESVEMYMYSLCKEKQISYPLMCALIEAESGYHFNISSSDGSCKGYCMISEKWHEDRMERLSVSDIYDPYGNIAVSIDYIAELFSQYGDLNQVLMCYNCGPDRAAELWEDGITETSYTKKIAKREHEISDEMYGK